MGTVSNGVLGPISLLGPIPGECFVCKAIGGIDRPATYALTTHYPPPPGLDVPPYISVGVCDEHAQQAVRQGAKPPGD